MSLNHFPPELKPILLPSDSRRRLDRFYLERGYSEYATEWKKVGEYRQREDHKARGHNNLVKAESSKTITSPRGEMAGSTKGDKHAKSEKKEKKGDKKEKHSHHAHEEGWDPVWFVEDQDHLENKIWTFSNEYWKIREQREALIKDNKDPGELHTPPTIKSTAADFATYHQLWENLLGVQTEDSNDKEKAEKYKASLKANAEKK